MTAQKKLKFSIDDIKRMSGSEVNENWDDVSDTLSRGYDQPPSEEDTEGSDDDE